MKMKRESKKRRAIRIIFYILATIIILLNVFTIFAFIVFNHIMVERFPHAPRFILYIYGALAWGNIIAMIALLKSRKWGLWLFLGVTIVIIILNFINRIDAIINPLGLSNLLFNLLLILGGLLGPLIVYLLLRPRWKQFK